MARQDFNVSVTALQEDGRPDSRHTAHAVVSIDPKDIYQSGIDATLRAMAWESLGLPAEDRLKDEVQPGSGWKLSHG